MRPRRTAYDVLPRHPLRLPGWLLRDSHNVGGREALARSVRRLLVLEAGRRASSLAEVALLREWVEVEAEEQTSWWLERLEPVDDEEPEEPADGLLRCSVCSEPFEREPGARGRPPSRCVLHRTPPRKARA